MNGRLRTIQVIALAVTLASCGGATASSAPSPSAKLTEQLTPLVTAARGELELTLSWSAGFLDATPETRRYADGFNRQYGLNIRTAFKPGPSFAETAAQLIQDYQQGAKASTDIFLGTETEIGDLQRAGVLLSEPWATWAPNIGNPRSVAAGGVAVRVQTRLPGITYNSAKLSGAAVPRSLADLLQPQFRGRVATTQSPAMLERLGGTEVWGAERTVGFVGRLAPQIAGYIDCGDEDRVARGEFDAFVFDCGSARVAQLKAKGTLIGWSVPNDAAFLGYLYMGVPRNAMHPNAAKLFINYMLSREAQDTMFEFEFADYHLAPGSKSFAEVDKATKSGVRFYELTVEAVLVDLAKGAKPLGPQLKSMLDSAVAARR